MNMRSQKLYSPADEWRDLFVKPSLIKISKAHKTSEKCVYYNVACKFAAELERGSLDNGEIRTELRAFVALWARYDKCYWGYGPKFV